MKTTDFTYEVMKIRVDRIADARGIIFSDKLKFVENALDTLNKGEVLSIYCSDMQHKEEIPDWVRISGHVFLGIIEESNYFKIIIQKGY